MAFLYNSLKVKFESFMCELCNINPFIIHDTLADEHDNAKPSADEKDNNDNPDNEQAHPISGGAL